ncbi:MAG: lysylphosphatidylglycerol synthase domain-containing protein [Chitinophagaceae bacterium]
MQLKSLPKRNIRIFIHYFLGPLLFIWLSYSIYHQLNKQPNLESSWHQIRNSFSSSKIWYLVFAIILMPVNWTIETIKWKTCIQRIQTIGFITAFKAVLSGVSFSVSTPNRVGEYLGRVLYMDDGNRLKAISLTITGSLSQLIITLVMGLTGLLTLRSSVASGGLLTSFWVDIIVYGTILAILILTLFYFKLAGVARWFERIRWVKKYAWLFQALEEFNATLLLQLLSLSALRFFVFIAQYYLLFHFFGVDVTWGQTLWAVSVSFLVMAVIPTITLFTDLSLRGEISLKLLGLFSNNHLGIGFASVGVWLINLIIPALAGSLLILSIKKIFLNKNEQSG